jgi:hypothetical protein
MSLESYLGGVFFQAVQCDLKKPLFRQSQLLTIQHSFSVCTSSKVFIARDKTEDV